jgi:hypothetical protein
VQAGTTTDASAVLAPINQFVLFAGLVLAAVWYRRRPEVHKRLMVLAMVGPLAGAPLTHLVRHWPLLRPAGTLIATAAGFVLLSLNAVYDRVSRGRIHPVSLWGAGAVFVWGLFFFGFVAGTAAWRDVSVWLLR